MGRPRTFDHAAVVDAALDTFWSHGYEGTSIGDLETATGLNRSSLYGAFGSKRGLFDAALARYVALHVDPVLAALERPGSGRADLIRYLSTLAQSFRREPRLAIRGCLIVNTMTELGAADRDARVTALAYRDRVRTALANAFRGMGADDADDRAGQLCATVMGALVTAHIDPEGAAALCDQLAAGIEHRETARDARSE